jgi:hypothetical protein
LDHAGDQTDDCKYCNHDEQLVLERFLQRVTEGGHLRTGFFILAKADKKLKSKKSVFF